VTLVNDRYPASTHQSDASASWSTQSLVTTKVKEAGSEISASASWYFATDQYSSPLPVTSSERVTMSNSPETQKLPLAELPKSGPEATSSEPLGSERTEKPPAGSASEVIQNTTSVELQAFGSETAEFASLNIFNAEPNRLAPLITRIDEASVSGKANGSGGESHIFSRSKVPPLSFVSEQKRKLLIAIHVGHAVTSKHSN
jgi:hypothetical protein